MSHTGSRFPGIALRRARGWGLAIVVGLSAAVSSATHCSATEPTGVSPPLTAVQPAPLERFEFSQVHMGTEFKLVFYAAERDLANRASEEAFARIAALDQALSDYRDDSELLKFCRTAGMGESVTLSAELWTVLQAAQLVARQSEGAFDVTCGPLVRQWRRARRQKQLPDPADLAEAREAVGHEALRLAPETRRGELTRPGMRLDLGGIAQGFAADEALRVLAAAGITRAVVDSSGDIALGEAPPDEPGWRVAVPAPAGEDHPPLGWLRLAHGAVSTSGDIYQHVVLDGRRFSHLVDPRTGWALADSPQVTVVIRPPTPRAPGPAPGQAFVARDGSPGMMADALATAVSVLGWEIGRRLVSNFPGGELLVVERSAEGWLQRATPGFWGSEVDRREESAACP